ncbi:MAG: SDR family NAD(P)-dependent oxidoreductase, partial [Cyclobacteriaceae bacterium]|nr:SDR family NAD(P)-dependent oxidoreductase [Cyclobacteriaceae bacterium]
MKNVLVTGSSTGFGLLITKRLLEKGYTVFATMRNLSEGNAAKAEKLNQFAQDKSGKLHLLDLDVTDESSVQAAVAKAVELEGPVDVLVNNAGVGQGGHTEAFDDAQFKKVFEVNVFGVQRMIRAVLPSMRQRNQGLVINVSSVMGRMIIPFAGIYTASKFALEG